MDYNDSRGLLFGVQVARLDTLVQAIVVSTHEDCSAIDLAFSPSVKRVTVAMAMVDASPQIHPHTAPTGGVSEADLGSVGCRGEHVMAGNGLASVHSLCNPLVILVLRWECRCKCIDRRGSWVSRYSQQHTSSILLHNGSRYVAALHAVSGYEDPRIQCD